MRMRWLCMAALAPGIASAQFTPFDYGGGAKTDKPWTEFKLNSKTRVKLDLQNATPEGVVKFFENVSGVTIVKDPALTGALPITSARPVSLNDAFQILATTLTLKGYSISKEGNLLVIKQAGKGGGGGGGPTNFDFTGGSNNSPTLRVYPIKYANASQLARVLNDVYQQSTNNTNGFQFQRGGGNRGGPGVGGPGAGGAGAQGGFQGFNMAQTQPQVRASSDDFSNSVIVNAPDRDQGQVKTLIDSLDKPSDLPQHTKVYTLLYASATDTASVVQNVLTANIPRGRGGATTTQTQGPQAFFNAIRGQTAGSGQVVSDPRTNSLIVTATDEDLKIVDDVIREIDHDVTVQSTTFVFPLNAARADTVSTIIQQAFGNRSGQTAPNSTTLNNVSGSVGTASGRAISSGSTSSTASRTGTGLTGSIPPNPDETMAFTYPDATQQQQMRAAGETYLPVKLADPNAQSGDLYTSIGVTQGFGGGGGGGFRGAFQGGGGGGGTTGQTTYTTGRTATGQLVQTRDLTGQVTVIPDINTNSIVVVTNPENAAIVRAILQQLDRVPKQVLIQTVIVEASLDATTKLGVEWNLTQSLGRLLNDPSAVGSGGTNLGVQSGATATTAPGFTYAVTGKGFTAFLQALQSDSKFQILATPRIFTTNNVQGQINVSQSIPYVTSIQTSLAGTPTYSYSFLSVGIILTIIPRILNNGVVTLDVNQTANELQGYQNVGNVNAPVVNQREASTTVSVKDGETIILGGIIQKRVTASVNKIPLLGDLPILGQLFRSTSKETNRTELLVFMTPHVVNDTEDARKLATDTLKEVTTDTRKSVDQFRTKGNNTGTGPGNGKDTTGGNP